MFGSRSQSVGGDSKSTIQVVQDEERFPKAVMDVLPSLASMPLGDDVVVNLLLLVVDAGESMGDRRMIRVRDAEGDAGESCLAKAIVLFLNVSGCAYLMLYRATFALDDFCLRRVIHRGVWKAWFGLPRGYTMS